MKISEVTSAYILGFIKTENDEQARNDLRLIMPAAKSYLKGYTKLDDQELDRHDDITLAYIALCQHMYDNRTFAVDCKEANRVIESIIGMHDCNLVG